MRGALLFGALVGPALAVPALAPRTDPPSPSTIATSTSGKGFSCQVVQEARCCATVTVVAGRAVGTSCAAAFGGIGYATCLAGETPLCGAAASADGTETGLAPSNTRGLLLRPLMRCAERERKGGLVTNHVGATCRAARAGLWLRHRKPCKGCLHLPGLAGPGTYP